MKKCFKCNREKPLDDFYVHRRMGDGHLNKCKECTKKDTRDNYSKNIGHYKQYEKQRAMLPHRVSARKEYIKTDAGRLAVKRATRRYRKLNPEKARANSIVNKATEKGFLKKEPCAICGKRKVHAHHVDYSDPYDVIWVCAKHHSWLHRP